MQSRRSDDSAITIERKIPLWGLIGLAGALLGQGVLTWSGQREQAIEMRHQSEQIKELTIEVKALTLQVSAKDGKDVEQDLRLNEISRRLIAVEPRGR